MRIYLEPTGIFSRAMVRIANALRHTLPAGVSLCSDIKKADTVVMYVIGADSIRAGQRLLKEGRRYVAVQCCLKTAGDVPIESWLQFWRNSALVWSYYDLTKYYIGSGDTFNFLHEPLGLDAAFLQPYNPLEYRSLTAITTGYVSGPGAEAIEEVWSALSILKRMGLHIGPKKVEGMRCYPPLWRAVEGISDYNLAVHYSHARYVAALRHIEGLELPAAEGLMQGARPILFDQPDLRDLYGDSAIYIPESSGPTLVADLVKIFECDPHPVTHAEREVLREHFNWDDITTCFWNLLLHSPKEVLL